jgi:hypothetical protein
MPCRARFTDTHGSVAVANSGAFGKRRARQGVCDALGVYVAQRVVELNESASLLETTDIYRSRVHSTDCARVQSVERT